MIKERDAASYDKTRMKLIFQATCANNIKTNMSNQTISGAKNQMKITFQEGKPRGLLKITLSDQA